MEEVTKRKIILVVGLLAIFIFINFIFKFGMNYGCTKTGGELLENDKGLICINPEEVNFCLDHETGKIIKKQLMFNTTFNFTI